MKLLWASSKIRIRGLFTSALEDQQLTEQVQVEDVDPNSSPFLAQQL